MENYRTSGNLIVLMLLFPALNILYSCTAPGDAAKDITTKDSIPEKAIEITDEHSDSIEVYDSIAVEPFLFSNWDANVDTILKYFPAGATVRKKVDPSPSDNLVIDTVLTIRHGETTFEYRTGDHEGYLDYAVITGNFIPFSREIKIGDSYQSIAGKINILGKHARSFNKVYIHWGDAQSTLIFEFNEGKLFKVTFWPYTG
jgi:hypothetical protein